MHSTDDDSKADNFMGEASSSEISKYNQSVSRGSTLDSFLRNGDGLHPAEEKLRNACMRGETCEISDGTRPKFATKENLIRASFLRYLILGGCEQTPIHQRGVHVKGAFIYCRASVEFGKCLELQAVTINQDVLLGNCKLDGSIILFGAKAKSLYLDGTSIHQLLGDGFQTDGGIFLRNEFEASGIVCLLSAKIGSDLDCGNARFFGEDVSIACDRIETKGSIFLSNEFHASGTVRLLGAKIGGDFDCENASFFGEDVSLLCDGIETKGSVFFNNEFHTSGTIRLHGAKIGGDLICRNGVFKSDFFAHNSNIGGNIFLDGGFQTNGTIHLPNASIKGNVYCEGGYFHSKQSAILANKATIEGNVVLGEVNAAGTFSFQSTTIKGDFSANGATLSGKPCVELRNATIEGTLHWRDIEHAVGRFNLGGASAKTINMDAASWAKPESIKLNNFTYLGFESLEQGANSNYWKRFLERQPPDDLAKKFRPRPWEHLAGVLASMGYEQEARSLRIERQRLHTNFLADHDPDRYGTGADGKKHRKIFNSMSVFWRRFVSGPLVDYGYRPGKAAIVLFALILLGTGIYWKASFNGIMTPTHPLIFKEAVNGFIPKECAENWVYFPDAVKTQCEENIPSEYSEFQSFIYAADIALPIVNLRMESDWAPRVVNTDGSRNWWGYSVRAFEWFLIIAGWLLSLLFASAVGGIIRR